MPCHVILSGSADWPLVLRAGSSLKRPDARRCYGKTGCLLAIGALEEAGLDCLVSVYPLT